MEKNRFKECREKTPYTQKQVALMIGVKPPQLSKWESGTGSPSRENCVKLANLYGVSVDYLLGRDDQYEAHVNTAPWDLDSMSYAEQEDATISILARGVKKMSPENRQKLLDVARVMFAEDFDSQGNKR